MAMNGFSSYSAAILMALALGTGACDVVPAETIDQASIPATAEDLADIEMTASALSSSNSSNAAVEVFHENFEGYPSAARLATTSGGPPATRP
jgi:hypothetical protein